MGFFSRAMNRSILALAFTGLSCTQKPKTPRERGAGVFNRACAMLFQQGKGRDQDSKSSRPIWLTQCCKRASAMPTSNMSSAQVKVRCPRLVECFPKTRSICSWSTYVASLSLAARHLEHTV